MFLVLLRETLVYFPEFLVNFVPLESEQAAYDDPVVQVVAQVHVVQADHPLLVSCLGAGGVALHVLLLPSKDKSERSLIGQF